MVSEGENSLILWNVERRITNEVNEKVSIKLEPKIWNWNNEDDDFLMIYIWR